MKSFVCAGVISCCVGFLSSCADPTMQHYEKAALMGTVGAGAGALIDSHNRWRGALIGGGLGAITGYGLGEVDARERERQQNSSCYPSCNQYQYQYQPPLNQYQYQYPSPPPAGQYQYRNW